MLGRGAEVNHGLLPPSDESHVSCMNIPAEEAINPVGGGTNVVRKRADEIRNTIISDVKFLIRGAPKCQSVDHSLNAVLVGHLYFRNSAWPEHARDLGEDGLHVLAIKMLQYAVREGAVETFASEWKVPRIARNELRAVRWRGDTLAETLSAKKCLEMWINADNGSSVLAAADAPTSPIAAYI